MGKKEFKHPVVTVEELQKALYKANLELMEANQRLQKMELARTEMFANISHDLRSPLSAIQVSLEYLERLLPVTDQEVQPVMNLMNQRVAVMDHMIKDIFLLTSLESGSMNMGMEEIELISYLEEIFYSYQAEGEFDGITVELKVPASKQIMVSIDPKQLQRVLDNLFQNAKKFASSNPCITLGLEEGEQQVIIYVRDNGMGVPSTELERIFDRSYTLQKARTPGKTGIGLGLSIAKSIVGMHRGNIWCESIEGSGSVFKIMLPLQTEG